jgi:hypothetical protein
MTLTFNGLRLHLGNLAQLSNAQTPSRTRRFPSCRVLTNWK